MYSGTLGCDEKQCSNATMNNRIEKILVAVDFSEYSLNALETASCLAGKWKARLHIIYVQDNLFEFTGINSLMTNSITSNYSSILIALAADIERKSGIDPVIIEESGHVTETILKAAISNQCELIVMGTHGASGYRNGYIGTTAYSVIKFAPCPVLLVPAARKWNSFSNPLFPIRPVITAFRHYDLIRNFIDGPATLHILGLSHSGQENNRESYNQLIAEIKDKLVADGIRPNSVISTEKNSIAQNILSQADESKSDLIILAPVIDISSKQFYIGPNIHHIIHNGKVPILIINKVNIHSLARLKHEY
jgi:nucleotide-binding universal stress UspA family protein